MTQETDATMRRRKRQLPSVPMHLSSKNDDAPVPEKKKYVVSLLEKQVADLTKRNKT